jgi:hypothetical protein
MLPGTSDRYSFRIRWPRRLLILLSVACVAVLLPLTAGAPSALASSSVAPTPKQYYLSLGDSYGFGLQLNRFFTMLNNGTYSPDQFNTGYTDVFAAMMRQIRPDQQVVNFSCPLTSAEAMVAGGCFFTDIGLTIHDEFTGAQLDAAVTFLREHPGQVSPVTISVGGIDLHDAISTCNGDSGCVAHSGLAQSIAQNLGTTLTRLRAAAPDAEILLLLPHNSLILDFPNSNPLWAAFLIEMRVIAAARNVDVVDAFAAINLTHRECELTFLCTDLRDDHPTDAGYALLGHMFFDAAGFPRPAN